MNFYQRFLGDYMRDTMHLSLAEHGAYSLLLDTYYATEKPLPSDYDALHRICRAMSRPEQESVKRVADQFFPIHADGMRHNRRADIEIASAQPKIRAAKENGKRGGRPQNPQSIPKVTGRKPDGLFTIEPNGFTSGFKSETQRQSSPEPEPHPSPEPQPPPASDAHCASPGSMCFSRYAESYRSRYHDEPVRNAKINSLFVQLVKRLGSEEAPEVAAFYVKHNLALYVRSGHAVDLLVRDAEKLRTEWRTGRRITETSAREADRKDNNLGIAEQLLVEERGGKHV